MLREFYPNLPTGTETVLYSTFSAQKDAVILDTARSQDGPAVFFLDGSDPAEITIQIAAVLPGGAPEDGWQFIGCASDGQQGFAFYRTQ